MSRATSGATRGERAAAVGTTERSSKKDGCCCCRPRNHHRFQPLVANPADRLPRRGDSVVCVTVSCTASRRVVRATTRWWWRPVSATAPDEDERTNARAAEDRWDTLTPAAPVCCKRTMDVWWGGAYDDKVVDDERNGEAEGAGPRKAHAAPEETVAAKNE